MLKTQRPHAGRSLPLRSPRGTSARASNATALCSSTAPTPSISFDLRGNFIDANPATARLLGYEMGELLDLPVRSFVVPEALEQMMLHFRRAVAGEA